MISNFVISNFCFSNFCNFELLFFELCITTLYIRENCISRFCFKIEFFLNLCLSVKRDFFSVKWQAVQLQIINLLRKKQINFHCNFFLNECIFLPKHIFRMQKISFFRFYEDAVNVWLFFRGSNVIYGTETQNWTQSEGRFRQVGNI
jgi:hypothetical protein